MLPRGCQTNWYLNHLDGTSYSVIPLHQLIHTDRIRYRSVNVSHGCFATIQKEQRRGKKTSLRSSPSLNPHTYNFWHLTWYCEYHSFVRGLVKNGHLWRTDSGSRERCRTVLYSSVLTGPYSLGVLCCGDVTASMQIGPLLEPWNSGYLCCSLSTRCCAVICGLGRPRS